MDVILYTALEKQIARATEGGRLSTSKLANIFVSSNLRWFASFHTTIKRERTFARQIIDCFELRVAYKSYLKWNTKKVDSLMLIGDHQIFWGQIFPSSLKKM